MKQLFEQILNEILAEQESANGNTDEQVFTPEQQRFLGKFAAYNSTSLGILYSKTGTGIEEFMLRAGGQLNLTPHVFNSLIQAGVISLQPYGSRRTPDWTIQLEIPLADVAKFAELSASEETPEPTADSFPDTGAGGGGGGGMTTADLGSPELAGGEEIPGEEIPAEVLPGETPGAETEAPVEEPGAEPETEEIPEVPQESFRTDGELIVESKKYQIYNYGSILEQSAKTLKQILNTRPDKIKIHSNSSRVLNRLPSGYIFHLQKIIEQLSKRLYTDLEREHLVADIMDNLAHNFGLTPNQILRAYTFYRHQNKLKNIIKK
jgi:hypothetical protein